MYLFKETERICKNNKKEQPSNCSKVGTIKHHHNEKKQKFINNFFIVIYN